MAETSPLVWPVFTSAPCAKPAVGLMISICDHCKFSGDHEIRPAEVDSFAAAD
jgi:hypothetical protein